MVNKRDFKIGGTVTAKRTIHYMIGQIPSDKICRGEECIVDGIDWKNETITVTTHADRYGPWYMEDFKLTKTDEKRELLEGKLRDVVLEQMKADFLNEDLTAIDELLTFTPVENLIGYLPESLWKKFKKLKK